VNLTETIDGTLVEATDATSYTIAQLTGSQAVSQRQSSDIVLAAGASAQEVNFQGISPAALLVIISDNPVQLQLKVGSDLGPLVTMNGTFILMGTDLTGLYLTNPSSAIAVNVKVIIAA
jgi:hypothetical protein